MRELFKRFAMSTPIILTIILVLPIVLSLWIIFTHNPRLPNLFPEFEENTEEIMLGEDTFETLIIKAYYSYELARIIEGRIEGEMSENNMAVTIGDTLRIGWFENEVYISTVSNISYIFNVDELKNIKQLNLSVNGLPLRLTLGILKLSYPRLRNLPDDFKSRILAKLDNHSFIKWLKEEGFTYSVENIGFSVNPMVETEFGITCRVEIELLIEEIEAFYELVTEPVKIISNANASKVLQISLEEHEPRGICVYMYKCGNEYTIGTIIKSKDPYTSGYTSTVDEARIRNGSYICTPGTRYQYQVTLNKTSELGRRILGIMSSNRLVNRLMEIGCYIDLTMIEQQHVEAYLHSEDIILTLRINLNTEKIESMRVVYFEPSET